MLFYAWSLRPHYTVWPDKFVLTMWVTVNVYLCSKGLGSEELRSVTCVLHAHITDPNKIPEHQSSGEQLPWLAIFHTRYTSCYTCSYVTPLKINTWKPAPDFSWTLPHVSFPFADFTPYPFTVNKIKTKYNSFFHAMWVLSVNEA